MHGMQYIQMTKLLIITLSDDVMLLNRVCASLTEINNLTEGGGNI